MSLVRPGAGMSTADRTRLDTQYRAAQSQKRYSSPTSAPKRLSAPVSTEIKKPNLLAQAYNALLSIPTPAPAGVGVPSRTNNPLAQTVEPVRVATRRAVGDFTAIPGVGEPSASPTATDIKQGNYVGPVLDYGNLALTATGVRGVRNRPIYGVHSSPVSNLDVINPRSINQAQSTALDAVPGSSYMWDAKSPYVGKGKVLENQQMNLARSDVPSLIERLDPRLNTLYLTKAPRRNVMIDANVPDSASLRVMGPQKVVAKLPIEQEALMAALRSYGINPRSQLAQKMIQKMRTSSPRSLRSISAQPMDIAESKLRNAIKNTSQTSPKSTARSGRPTINLEKTIFDDLRPLNLDPEAPLKELLQNPTVRKIFNDLME